MGIKDNLIRYAVGIEDTEHLIADLALGEGLDGPRRDYPREELPRQRRPDGG